MGGWQALIRVLPLALCACASVPAPRTSGPRTVPPTHARFDLEVLEAPGHPTDWNELTRLMREKPTLDSLLRQAFLYHRVNRPNRTKEVLEQASRFELPPRVHPLILYGRTLALRDLGENRAAEEARQEALTLDLDPTLRGRLVALGPLESEPPLKKGPALIPGLEIRTRAQWSASPTELPLIQPMGRIWRLTIHHSAMPCNDLSSGAVASQIRAIQNHHQGRQWADMGYHFLIDPSGAIWEGRPLAYQGAHAGSPALNQGNIGVCMLGDLHQTPPPKTQVAALERLVRTLTRLYKIPANQILGHRDLKATLCPGEYGYRQVLRLRAALR